MVSLFIIVVLLRKLRFFLWSAVADEQVEHEDAELEAGDNVEGSGEGLPRSNSNSSSSWQVHSSHWMATDDLGAESDEQYFI